MHLEGRAPLRVRAVLESPAPVTVNGPPTALSIRSPNIISKRTKVSDEEFCEIANVEVDNTVDPKFTVISLKVKSFPGLMRLITWVLTGLRLEVHRASLRTDLETGIENDLFYVTDEKGRKLKDHESVKSRLEDFIQYCSMPAEHLQAQVFQQGPIKIDNSKHPTCTAMSILVSSISPDEASDGRYLLEVVSTLTAVGVSIAEADILCDESRTSDMPGKWRFLLQNQDGNKLDYVQISGLIYTLASVLKF